MYINYFGFNEKPFKLKPDSRFFYSTPDYQQAYDDIVAGVNSRRSLTALIGASGSGKTMLLRRCMQEELDKENIQLLKFANTTLPFSEVVDYLCKNLDLNLDEVPLTERMRQLQLTLQQKDEAGLTVVLVIDDAQNLTTDTLNDLLSIANPPNIDKPLIVTIVAGLPELVERLERLERSPHVARLTPLAESEVENFIAHQLQIAGYPRQDIFTPNPKQAAGSRSRPRAATRE